MKRNILGVMAGYAAWSLLWLASNAAIVALMPGSIDENGAIRSVGLLLALLGISIVLSVVSGWLTTLVASGTMRAALWTGILLLATGIPIQLASWELLPVWYHLTFLAFLVPATVVGGAMGPRSRGAPVPA